MIEVTGMVLIGKYFSGNAKQTGKPYSMVELPYMGGRVIANVPTQAIDSVKAAEGKQAAIKLGLTGAAAEILEVKPTTSK